jgi:hypothetical protein
MTLGERVDSGVITEAGLEGAGVGLGAPDEGDPVCHK